jgi:hypothetical protein
MGDAILKNAITPAIRNSSTFLLCEFCGESSNDSSALCEAADRPKKIGHISIAGGARGQLPRS